LGRSPADWDLATDARPEHLLEVFPGAVYENAFGTVAVRRDDLLYEITTFRTDHDYADFRRPHRVEFGDTIEVDLARRDFTVNAIAWGAPAPGPGEDPPEPYLFDPFDGRSDAERRVLRAVGDPLRRFEEDALRMIRAVRLAATLGFEIETGTREAMEARAELVRHLSGERIATELQKLLAAPWPSVGLRIMEETGILRHVVPQLADQRGIEQNKIPGEDLWDHTLRCVDAAPADRPVVRLAALLHDIGKAAVASDGHFHDHERVGADLAKALLERLRAPRAVSDRVVHLIRHHMFTYESAASDAAIRRLIRRVGTPAIDELLALRRADNVGSGFPPDSGHVDELRARIEEQLTAQVALERSDLAIDGDDLIAEFGLVTGPTIGHVLDELLERVLADPDLNDRPTLLLLAQSMLQERR
jgi:tRNA nucleotidyltransferase (CCA-adding enzyme)